MPREYSKIAAVERFWPKVEFTGPVPEHRPDLGSCWLWTGGKNSEGYGRFYDGTREVQAHRFAYEFCIGPIPNGLTIDHLCRTHNCVEPLHLEPVTGRENLLRGMGAGAINARKTHCHRGHEFTVANTRLSEKGWRYCRACGCIKQRDYIARKAALL